MIRYGTTCIDTNGVRKLSAPALWARYLWDNKEEAETWLKECMSQPDNLRRLEQIHGPQSLGTFQVDPFECWDHGEPKGWYPND